MVFTSDRFASAAKNIQEDLMGFRSSNSFELIGMNGVPGIPRTTESGQRLPIESASNITRSERVLWTKPQKNLGSQSTVQECTPNNERAKQCWVTYFEVRKLNFGGSPFLDGLNLWSGGEWYDEPVFWERGTKKPAAKGGVTDSQPRIELWVMGVHERLLLVDPFGGVRMASYTDENIRLQPADPAWLAVYIGARGVKMKNHKGALWAYKNLECLKEGFPTLDLNKPLAQVRTRLDALSTR